MRYRPHIDGLRALAVLGVLVFHFGASWLPGGFVGVDVFFVISGFLISKSLYRDVAAGTFSLAEFYERRVRRIAPAFIVTTAVTSAAAGFILFPGQLVRYSDSLMSSGLFAANIYFYATANYFAPAAEELPLLHLWSLGVEEQFYVIFPLAVVAGWRFGRLALTGLIAIALVASLAACEIMLRRDPSAAFYLLPFRAFELLIGAMVALPGVRVPTHRALSSAAVLVGVALIAAAMCLLTQRTRFPGIAALLPCLGAALVIWGGEREETWAARLLSGPVIRLFGRISYSLYLVHWPLAVFARMLLPELHPWAVLVGGCALSTLLAWLMWTFVEQPFRRRAQGSLLSRRAAFGATAAAIVGLTASAAFVRAAGGFPRFANAEITRVLAYRDYAYQSVFREGRCFLRPEQTVAELAPECLPSRRPSVVLWGSSHIAQFFSGLAGPAAERGFELGQITGSACIPLVDWDHPSRPNCRALNAFALNWLLTNKPSMVVMGADPITEPAMLALLDASIRKLAAAGIKVVLVGPAPYYNRPVPVLLADRLRREEHGRRPSGDLQPISSDAEAVMRRRFANDPAVGYVSFLDQLCDRSMCEIAERGVPFHFDTVHFTAEGSNHYGRRLASIIFEARSSSP